MHRIRDACYHPHMHTAAAPPAYDEAVPKKPMRNRVVREEDAYWLAAQMEAAIRGVDLSDALRPHIRKMGSRHYKAAREAWAQLEAAAPPGKNPTRAQVQDFLETYRDEWESKR